MRTVFENPHETHALGDSLLLMGLLLALLGALGGYLIDAWLPLAAQIVAHLLVIVGPVLVKIGYVMRLNARQRLRLTC